MQTARRVLLNHESQFWCFPHGRLAARLRRLGEIALGAIRRKFPVGTRHASLGCFIQSCYRNASAAARVPRCSRPETCVQRLADRICNSLCRKWPAWLRWGDNNESHLAQDDGGDCNLLAARGARGRSAERENGLVGNQ